MAEAEPRLQVQTALVRAAVMLALVHARQQPAVDLARPYPVEDADDSAHGRCSAPGQQAVVEVLVPAHHGVDPELLLNAVARRLADVSRAREALGFQAEVPLDAGLRDLVRWWSAQAQTRAARRAPPSPRSDGRALGGLSAVGAA